MPRKIDKRLTPEQAQMAGDNYPLMMKLLYKYYPTYMCKPEDRERFILVGHEALCEAAYYWDATCGYKFSTYLGKTLRSLMWKREFRKMDHKVKTLPGDAISNGGDAFFDLIPDNREKIENCLDKIAIESAIERYKSNPQYQAAIKRYGDKYKSAAIDALLSGNKVSYYMNTKYEQEKIREEIRKLVQYLKAVL